MHEYTAGHDDEALRVKETIARYLGSHEKVVLAFLFGSFSKGKNRRSSDVDVAVYLRSSYSQADIRDIWNNLEDLTHRDVELVVLNDASPGIAWAAMKGKALVNRNPRLALELMLETSREAEDFREFQMSFIRQRNRYRRRANGQAVP